MIDLKSIRSAAEAATPEPWIQPGEGNMAFICMMTPATILELLDRLEAAEKDAARYRHFRHGNRLTVKCKSAIVIFGPNTERDYPEQLDVAIDAAIKDEQK